MNVSPDTTPQQDQDPLKTQVVTPMSVQFQTLSEVIKVLGELVAVRESLNVLTQLMGSHVKLNIDTIEKINEYVQEQIEYRVFRQAVEENTLQLELDRKKLELEYMEKELTELEEEKQVKKEGGENPFDKLVMEHARQQLEIEALKQNLELLEKAKQSARDSKDIRDTNPGLRSSSSHVLSNKAKETVVLTIVGTVTAASVGAIIAFIVWLIRFYISNT